MSDSKVTASDPIVTAIVVTHNGANTIIGCIASLKRSSYPVKILLIDNCSKDRTIEMLESIDSIQVISLNENVGFGRANNVGISHALENGADFVFLLNQDAMVQPDTIGSLLNEAVKCRPGIFAPMQLNDDGSTIDPYFSDYLVRSGPEFISDLYFARETAVKYRLSFVNAAAWLIDRECLTTVGGFDPIFFMYGEDDDYCRRVRYHGYNIYFVPDALVFHARGHISKYTNSDSWTVLQRRKSSQLLLLKRLEGRFRYWMTQWLIDVIGDGLKLLSRRDLSGLHRHLSTTSEVFRLIPSIRRNRAECKSKGPHWLTATNCNDS